MYQRNTPEAPVLERCETCGVNRLDGNGPIVDLRGHRACQLCADGALELVRDEPETFEFGPDGRLRRKTPDPHIAAKEAAVTALHEKLTELLAGERVTVQTFHPRSGVALVLPSGYRWHVFIAGGGIVPFRGCVAALFTAGLELMRTVPLVDLTDLTDVVPLVRASTDPDTPIGEAITASALQHLDMSLFDPDTLLH